MFKIEFMSLARADAFHTEYRVELLCPLHSTSRVCSSCAIQPHANRVEANRVLVDMLAQAANEAETIFGLTAEESATLTSEMLSFIALRIPMISAGYGE